MGPTPAVEQAQVKLEHAPVGPTHFTCSYHSLLCHLVALSHVIVISSVFFVKCQTMSEKLHGCEWNLSWRKRPWLETAAPKYSSQSDLEVKSYLVKFSGSCASLLLFSPDCLPFSFSSLLSLTLCSRFHKVRHVSLQTSPYNGFDVQQDADRFFQLLLQVWEKNT